MSSTIYKHLIAKLTIYKEVIYSYGRAIGGKAVGTWFADNTEMIYSEDEEPEAIGLFVF